MKDVDWKNLKPGDVIIVQTKHGKVKYKFMRYDEPGPLGVSLGMTKFDLPLFLNLQTKEVKALAPEQQAIMA